MPKFKGQLQKAEEGRSWAVLTIPFDVPSVFGAPGRIAITGTLNGAAFRSSLFPTGDGHHYLMVNKAMQAVAKAQIGDEVEAEIERDDAPRPVPVPADLAAALVGDAEAKSAFDKLSPSHRRAYVDWITESKATETRTGRIAKILENLKTGA